MAGTDIRFYLSGGASNTNPAASLGGVRSTSTQLRAIESTFTSSQVSGAGHVVADTARIGDGDGAHVGKWMLALTGAASLGAARVVKFDSASGRFHLDRPLHQSLAASGDAYVLFVAHNLFDLVTQVQCSEGHVDHRMLYARNESGVTLTGARFYVRPLDEGPCTLEVMPNLVTGAPSLTIADEETDPRNSFGFITGTGFTTRNTFGRLDARPVEPENGLPWAGVSSWTNNGQVAIWIRRTIPPDSELRRRCAFMLILQTTVTGQNPSPLTGAVILAWKMDGVSPVATITRDRSVYIAGGARLTGTLTDSVTGEPIGPGRDVELLVDGPGTLTGEDNPQTDENGIVSATYAAPTDPAQEGATADAIFRIGAGEEVF